jgi:hypothetical protein
MSAVASRGEVNKAVVGQAQARSRNPGWHWCPGDLVNQLGIGHGLTVRLTDVGHPELVDVMDFDKTQDKEEERERTSCRCSFSRTYLPP